MLKRNPNDTPIIKDNSGYRASPRRIDALTAATSKHGSGTVDENKLTKINTPTTVINCETLSQLLVVIQTPPFLIRSKTFLNKNPSNVLATLSEFTAQSVSMAINKNKHVVKDIIVCGGGARNKDLLRRISNLTNTNVKLSDTYGYNLHAVESMAFAWLGYKRLNLMPIKIQTKTNGNLLCP